MSTQAIATYENTEGTETAYDEPTDGASLFRATVGRRFQGAFTGNSVAEVIICRSASDRMGYVATDRFVGHLDERAGSCVIQHGGPIDRGVLRSFGYIVPGSGTDNLRGLRGDVSISVTPEGQHTLTLNYDFEE
ncbi:MAG: DUF3224 domain-containing protein [Roseiflexaceae bacterium]